MGAIALLAIAVCLILEGCSSNNPTIEDPTPGKSQVVLPPAPPRTPRPPTPTAAPFLLHASSTPIATTTPLQGDQTYSAGFGPDNFPPDVNPLTGLKVSDPTLLNRRPMAIKISNFPREDARPQWGLNAADHIYEYYLEDGLTRFIGIFYGQDASRVGPVRSGRPFDINILRMYKSILAFGYADDRVIDPWTESDLKNYLVIEKPDNCPPMCRIGPQSSYNTLFTNTQQLSQYVTDRGTNNDRQSLNGLRFEDKSLAVFGGGQVDQVAIRYSLDSYNRWDYDPTSQRYLRWQEVARKPAGEEVYAPLFDNLTNQQVAADNLVILLVPVKYYFLSNSTEIYDFQLTGQGAGYALREGKIFAITWKRTRLDEIISLSLNGSDYPLKPGNVWFEVLSADAGHSVSGQNWNFSFTLPPTPTPTPKPGKTKKP